MIWFVITFMGKVLTRLRLLFAVTTVMVIVLGR
jgi:hypothetical protein